MNRSKNRISLFQFKSMLGKILFYQICSKTVGAGFLFLLSRICGLLLWHMGRPAFTSGDLPFLMRSWQGWVILLIGFVILVVYVMMDIHVVILMSDKILRGEKVKLPEVIAEAFRELKYYCNGFGILVILFVSFAVPLIGFVPGISLMEEFVIPEFIMSVIEGTPFLRILYGALIIFLIVLSVIYVFTFNGVIRKNMTVHEGMKHSKVLIRKNIKRYIIEMLKFAFFAILIYAAILVVIYIVPIYILRVINLSVLIHRIGIVFFSYLFLIAEILFSLLFSFFFLFKITLLFFQFDEEEREKITTTDPGKHTLIPILTGGAIALILAGSIITGYFFDQIFPKETTTYVVAHRAGGTLGNENTVMALKKAIEYDARYAEIDVQRTRDDHYVINHDDDFERCCGEPRRSDEMTLAEIKKLGVINANNPFSPVEEVATIEEMLDAAKGQIGLYIELKGPTADEKMAEDVIGMVLERDMLDEVMFISMNYSLIKYIEDNYPEVKTGYLCFFSAGEIAQMKCDALLLEAETATSDNIDAIHEAGKTVSVWTVNTVEGIAKFMTSDADGIITDEVETAKMMQFLLLGRDDETRVIQRILNL